jgi:hypothetical protein
MAQTNVQAFSGDVEISSNLAVDTNTLFVDSVGNKVGVGTSSPGTPFDIYKSDGGEAVYAQKIQTDNASTASSGALGPGIGFYQRWWSSGGVQVPMAAIHCIKTQVDGTDGGGLAFRAGSGNLGTRMVINHDGNVGIGKDPDSGKKLDVNGTVKATTLEATSISLSGQISAATLYGTHTYHNNTQFNYYYYDTLGSDNVWRNIMQHGNQTHAFLSLISFSAGYSQANSVRVLEYFSGGTSGGVSTFQGSNQPVIITQGRVLKHNSGGGTIFSQFRILPFMI